MLQENTAPLTLAGYGSHPLPLSTPSSLHDEVVRLFGLSDRWLAQALLALSREARSAAPALRPDDYRQDARLVWDIAPEIARRLGARKFLPLEAHADFARLSLRNMRLRLHDCLIATGTYLACGNAWAILTLPPENGNIVAIGMDRLCRQRGEGPDESTDPLCRDVAMACIRQKLPRATAWTPLLGLPVFRTPITTPNPAVPGIYLYQRGFPA